jgi:hypothetical protein
VKVRFDEEERWLVLTRGSVAVTCNFAGRAQRIHSGIERDSLLLLASDPNVRLAHDLVELPAESVAVLSSVPIRT